MTPNLLKQTFHLSQELVTLSNQKGLMIATAESCTAGLIGAAITATSGSSGMFRGGIIAYHNDIKINILDVDINAIEQHGAVSKIVAKQMAANCRTKLNADISVSVTGIAGPSGGSPDKPIGTVWMGLATKHLVTAKLFEFGDLGRNKVRDHTCLEALRELIEAVRSASKQP